MSDGDDRIRKQAPVWPEHAASPEGDAQNRSIGGIADLAVTHDVGAELRLSVVQLKTLEEIARRGGEILWDRGYPAKQETLLMLKDLIDRWFLTSVELSTQAVRLTLTDKARNVLAEHGKSRIVAGKVQPIEA